MRTRRFKRYAEARGQFLLLRRVERNGRDDLDINGILDRRPQRLVMRRYFRQQHQPVVLREQLTKLRMCRSSAPPAIGNQAGEIRRRPARVLGERGTRASVMTAAAAARPCDQSGNASLSRANSNAALA